MRIAGIPLIIFALFFWHPYIAVIIFLLIMASDLIDGWLARKLNQVTELGKFLDPLADKILVISILITLVEIKNIPSLPVLLIAGREIATTCIRVMGTKVIGANYFGKTKTFLQTITILMLILNVAYANWMLWITTLVTIISGVDIWMRRK